MHPCFIFIGLWHWCINILAAKIDFTNQTALPFWSFSHRIVVSSEFAVLKEHWPHNRNVFYANNPRRKAVVIVLLKDDKTIPNKFSHLNLASRSWSRPPFGWQKPSFPWPNRNGKKSWPIPSFWLYWPYPYLPRPIPSFPLSLATLQPTAQSPRAPRANLLAEVLPSQETQERLVSNLPWIGWTVWNSNLQPT